MRTYIAAAVFAFAVIAVMAVPIIGNATLCVDDFVWIIIANMRPTLVESLQAGWPAYLFYRPFDILANWLIDPVTLLCWPVLVFQLVAFVWMLAGMARVMMATDRATPTAILAAATWLVLHPATQLSLWSAGTLSQTLCGAAGLWVVGILLEAFRTGTRPHLIPLIAVSATGVLAKELFIGWAIATAALIVVHEWCSTPQGSGRAMLATRRVIGWTSAVLAIVGPPAAYLGLRFFTAGLSRATDADSHSPYTLHGPVTIVMNSGIAILGMFLQGPVHWARLLGAPWNFAPFAGASLSAAFAVAGSRAVRESLAWAPGRSPILLLTAVGLCAVWPALLIGRFSELYVMGSNALVAALVGIGIDTVISARRDTAGIRRPFAWGLVGLAALAVIAIGGFLSRSYHFRITWEDARLLRLAAHAALAGAERGDLVKIHVPDEARGGPTHSKYIVPPAVAANLPRAFGLLEAIDPGAARAVFDWPDMPENFEGVPLVLPRALPCRVMW